MTDEPSRALSLSARIRSVTSDTEPAANGSMTRIGRDGNFCAEDGIVVTNKALAATKAAIMRSRFVIMVVRPG